MKALGILMKTLENQNKELIELKDELTVARNTLSSTLKQSGTNYFEFIFENNEVFLSEIAKEYFGLPEVIENYPEDLFKKGIVYKEDIPIYRENIRKIKSGELDHTQFEIRFRDRYGNYIWHRKYFTTVYDKQGNRKKAVGTVYYIEEEIKNKQKYELEMQNRKLFNDRYFAYAVIDVTENSILELGPTSVDDIGYEEYKGFERYLKFISTKALTGKVNKKLETVLNSKYLLNEYYKGKNPRVEYRAKLYISERYIWAEARINMLNDPNTGNVIAFISHVSIDEKHVIKTFFKQLMGKQSNYIARIDKDSECCTVYANKDNLFKFPEGLSYYTYDEIEIGLKKAIDDLNIKSKGVLSNIGVENSFEKYTVGRVYEHTFEICKNEKESVFLRSNSYLSDDENSLFYYIDDVTKLVQRERDAQNKLKEAMYLIADANKTKTDFIGRMSHDIRTPLNAVLGFSNFGIEENRDETDVDYFKQIRSSGEYILKILDDVLDIHRMHKNKRSIKPEIVEIDQFNKYLIRMVEDNAKKNNITLEINYEDINNRKFRFFDIGAMQEILVNLISNAIKYTLPGGRVRILGEVLTDDEVLYIISDNGIGMSKEFVRHMYDSFERESRTELSENNGTGLGLTIVKELCDLMGAELKCETEKGVGTTFSVKIKMPIPTNDELNIFLNKRKKVNKPMNVKNVLGKNILMCEDNDINILIAKKMLSQMGANITVAKNGLIGLELVKSNDYDCIIMDIRMPIMNGIEASKKIRKFNKEVPIIAISANAYDEDIAVSISAGMNYHLSKPINKNLLLETLNKALK